MSKKIDRSKMTPMERAKRPGISPWRCHSGTSKQMLQDRYRAAAHAPHLTRLVKE